MHRRLSPNASDTPRIPTLSPSLKPPVAKIAVPAPPNTRTAVPMASASPIRTSSFIVQLLQVVVRPATLRRSATELAGPGNRHRQRASCPRRCATSDGSRACIGYIARLQAMAVVPQRAIMPPRVISLPRRRDSSIPGHPRRVRGRRPARTWRNALRGPLGGGVDPPPGRLRQR